MLDTYLDIIKKIHVNLSDDLLKSKYKNQNQHIFFGHCYVATEALYHLIPETERKNWIPQILNIDDNQTHWFLKNRNTNEIIDITKEQFSYELDYANSKGIGFLTKNPSKRTIELLRRVGEELFHHHKIVINNTYIAVIPIKTFKEFKSTTLRDFKNNIEKTYDKCFIFNEIEFVQNKKIIKNIVLRVKNAITKKIHARKCEIINHISSEEKSKFLKKNHIQGNDKSSIHIGLMFENRLISMMTFDNSNGINGGLNKNTFELSRYATESDTIINGSFQKLLKYFICNYHPHKIISFADKNLSTTKNIYTKNNFALESHLKPDFKYYDPESNRLYHKLTYGTLYKKRNNLSDLEYSNIIIRLDKIWNAGKFKYHIRLDDSQNIIFGLIYKIINKLNNKIYIGQTIRSLSVRKNEYSLIGKKELINKSINNHLFNAFKKYGFENFEFIEIDTAKTIDELNEKEIQWISYYDSTNKEKGYNIELGGRNSSPSEETIQKMSNAAKGRKQSNNWICNRIAKAGSEDAKKYGKLKSDKEKSYLSEISPKFWEGKTRDQETRDKISISKKGQLPSNIKHVYKIDIENNILLDTYISTAEASRKNLTFTQSKISRICNNKAKSNEKFTFSFSRQL